MPIMKVIRDAAGQVINVGEWDYRISRVEVTDLDTGETLFDQREDGAFVPRTMQVFNNPLPEGAYEDKANIQPGPDGGLIEVTA